MSYGSKFGRHLGLLWKDLIPHLRVLLHDLFKKFKKKKRVSPNFITSTLVPMVDDIFLRVDLRKKDYNILKNEESIAFFASHFRLGLILLVFLQKKQKVGRDLAILYVVWINCDGSPVYESH